MAKLLAGARRLVERRQRIADPRRQRLCARISDQPGAVRRAHPEHLRGRGRDPGADHLSRPDRREKLSAFQRVDHPWRVQPDPTMLKPMSEGETSGGPDFGFGHVPSSEKAALVRAVFNSVAPRYDLMNDLMSGGIHRWWKAEVAAKLQPRPGQRLLDVAGGTGDIALLALPRLVPEGEEEGGGGVVVCDINEKMLAVGRARALDRGILTGIEWLCADAERLPIASAQLRSLHDRLRPAERHPDRGGTRRGAARSQTRRALSVSRIHPQSDAAAAAALRFPQLPGRAVAGPDRHRRSRGLCLSGREHPTLSARKASCRR